MMLAKLNNVNQLKTFKFNNDSFYFWFPCGLGDLYIVTLLKDELERQLNGKIVFIIQDKHHLILDYYGIDYISILSYCRGINCSNTNVPKKGCIYGAHPMCNNKKFIDELHKYNGIEWYKKYFGIDDNYTIDESKYIKNIQCSKETRQKIYDICGKNVEDVMMFIPDAISTHNNCIELMNKTIDEQKDAIVLCNSIRNIQLNKSINVQLSLSELLEICFNCKQVFSNRNGICDVIQSIKNKLTIFYDKDIYSSWAISKMFNNNHINEIIINKEITSNEKIKIVEHKKIKIAFEDGAMFCQKLVFQLLSSQYDCIIDQTNPDLLIYAPYGRNHFNYRCKTLYVTPENDVPNFNTCDYAISQNHIEFENRHCRIPFFVFNKEYRLLCNNEKMKVENAFNRKFCFAAISDNLTADPRRIDFFMKLHQKNHIVSMGRELNSIGYVLPKRANLAENNDEKYTNPSKIEMANKFKFTLALENSCVNGYITEKITDAFAANSIPIYFGANDICNEFNSKSFIDIMQFNSFDDAIQYILDIDKDKNKYLEMLNSSNVIHKDYLEKLQKFLINCIKGPIFEHRYGRILQRHF